MTRISPLMVSTTGTKRLECLVFLLRDETLNDLPPVIKGFLRVESENLSLRFPVPSVTNSRFQGPVDPNPNPVSSPGSVRSATFVYFWGHLPDTLITHRRVGRILRFGSSVCREIISIFG